MPDYNADDEQRRKDEEWARQQSSQAGVTFEADDAAKLSAKNPEDREQFMRDLEAQYQRRAAPTDGRVGDSQDESLYDTRTHQYIGPQVDPGAATSQYSSSGARQQGSAVGAQGMGGEGALQALLSLLQGNQQKQEKQQGDLRQILMNQLGMLQSPVSEDTPGIRESLSANRNANQRAEERMRGEIAERRAYDDSGGVGSKAYMTDVDRLGTQRAEAEAGYAGDKMFEAMQQRQQQLQQLLSQAMQIGDAESARSIQAQLNAIQMQLNQSNFYDDSAYRYAALGAHLNQNALNPFV
jgi:hypothetical protein